MCTTLCFYFCIHYSVPSKIYSTSVPRELMHLIHFVPPSTSFPRVATTTLVSTACLVWSFVSEELGKYPGGPMVKTLHFRCWGPRVQSLVRKLRSHTPRGAAKNKLLYKWNHTALVFLHLTDFTLHNILKIHPCWHTPILPYPFIYG